MKRFLLLICFACMGIGASMAQDITGKWNVPIPNQYKNNGMDGLGEIEFRADHTFTTTMKMWSTTFLEAGVNWYYFMAISGKYELSGKALSLDYDESSVNFNGTLSFAPNCSLDANARKKIKEVCDELDRAMKSEIRSFAKMMTSGGMYKQILMLNETTLMYGRPGSNPETLTRVMSDQQLRNAKAKVEKKKEERRNNRKLAEVVQKEQERAAEAKAAEEARIEAETKAAEEAKVAEAKAAEEARLAAEAKTAETKATEAKAVEEARLAAQTKAEVKVIEETKTTTGETKQPAGTRSANDTGAEQAVNKTVVEEETLQNKDIGVAKQGLKIVYANSGRELQNVDFHIAEDFIQYKKARSYAKLGLGLMGAGGALIGVGVLSGKKESKMRNQWRNEEDKAYNSYINSITSSSNKYDSDYAKLVDECGFYRDGVLYIYTDKYDYFQSARQALLDEHAARDSRITMQYDSDVEAIKGRYENQCETMNTVKIISYLGGTVSIITGAIFEIVGNVKISKVAKQQNNRQIVSLDFGAQPNGIGFALTF